MRSTPLSFCVFTDSIVNYRCEVASRSLELFHLAQLKLYVHCVATPHCLKLIDSNLRTFPPHNPAWLAPYGMPIPASWSPVMKSCLGPVIKFADKSHYHYYYCYI